MGADGKTVCGMADVILTHDEAECLKNHLEWYIIQEIKDDVDYDNIDFLCNMIHIYEKCKREAGDD